MLKLKTCLIDKPPFTKTPFVSSRLMHACIPALIWRMGLSDLSGMVLASALYMSTCQNVHTHIRIYIYI